MFKRLFFSLLGLGAGVALGVYAVYKVESVRSRLTPRHLAGSAGTRATVARGRLTEALAAGRAAAAAREAELRAAFRVDGAGTDTDQGA